MLTSLKRVIYYVDNIEQAKDWYNAVLNIKPLIDAPFAKIYNIGDCSLSLLKSKRPTNEANNRIDVYWEVDDIDAALDKFVQQGAKIKRPIKEAFGIRTAQLIDPFDNVIGITGKFLQQEDRSIENQPSETAQKTAFCRAAATKEKRMEIRGPDYLAELFITDDAKKMIHKDDSRSWVIQTLLSSPLYGYVISRTAFIDSIFKNACKDNIPQIVFLGAGYDTRSYRFIDNLKSTRIFELDVYTTQQLKIEILKNNNIDIPDSLSFIPINFKTDDLYNVLSEAGFDSSKKTLFIWEGVTYYLNKEEVEETLKFIQKYSSGGSVICFDYLNDEYKEINPSEPHRFWITYDKIKEMLSNYGMNMEEHIDSTEMTKRYLTLNDGTIAEEILPSACLIKAFVAK